MAFYGINETDPADESDTEVIALHLSIEEAEVLGVILSVAFAYPGIIPQSTSGEARGILNVLADAVGQCQEVSE